MTSVIVFIRNLQDELFWTAFL